METGELPDWRHYFEQAIGTLTDPGIIGGILDSERDFAPDFIRQSTDNIGQAVSGYLPSVQESIGGVADADIASDKAARTAGSEFFENTYGSTIDSMRAGNRGLYDLIDSQSDQAMSLGDSAQDIIANAGKLNERERFNVEQATRSGLQRQGRLNDNSALATEIGNVVEAERLDRNQDLGVAAGLLNTQSNITGMVNSVEQPYVRDVFNLNQDPYTGLVAAESGKGIGTDVGPSMFDVGSLYGIAQGDYNLATNRLYADQLANQQSRQNDWQLAMGVADIFGLPERIEQGLFGLFGGGEGG